MLLNSGARAGTTIIQDNFYRMDNIEKAKNRLIHFIKEMSAWEIACEEIDEQDIEEIEKLRQQKELLTDIFRKHCTAKREFMVVLIRYPMALIMIRTRRKLFK